MSEVAVDHAQLVPHPIPVEPVARILLYAMRRMAIGGLDDAHAANVLLGQFGLSYRRPLIILRALMLEVSSTSQRSISIAPCCCRRMTADEALLLGSVESATGRPDLACRLMAELTATLDCLAPVSAAQALGQAFEDMGRKVVL
ncbi:Carboxymuconolactone decarboxylase-like domain-containing protein [Sphingomonas antarctica]|uniref:DUF6628 family protein n=1 Tax=Sphingomonas antarctica TaxID=2040274 RepID=UPI0039EB99AC